MPEIQLDADSCRGCRLCLDICPVEVFGFNEADEKARVEKPEDCIACLSCSYLCPSGTIVLTDYPVVKNFYRDRIFSRRVERFL